MYYIDKLDEIGLIEKSIIAPIDIEEINTTDPIVILTEKGNGRSLRNLLIREDAYDTVRTRDVLPIHQIKIAKRETKRRHMVCIKNTPGEDDGYRLKKDSSSGIYMTSVKEDQFRILADNRRKQDEVKQNALQANSIKNSSRIIKQGILFHKILSTVARIYSVTDTTDESTESALQDITPLSFDNLKDAFLHLGGNIHDFPDLKK